MSLTNEQIKAIEKTLLKGDRVEIIPIKNDVKIVKVKRETIKNK